MKAKRTCLKCGKLFNSSCPGNRRCPVCDAISSRGKEYEPPVGYSGSSRKEVNECDNPDNEHIEKKQHPFHYI